jgi:hypothetical protein
MLASRYRGNRSPFESRNYYFHIIDPLTVLPIIAAL